MLNQSDLNQFMGTSQYHHHFLNRFVFTDGVKYLAEQANAYWLLDAIASYQQAELLKDSALKYFQVWKLTVAVNPQNPDSKTAQLVCDRDKGDIVVTQNFGVTDFPLPEVSLFLIRKVLMLPSEY